nr:uncharacterized protein LOC112008705 [Quercus suber]POE55516.1 hypothetical protein CFP56_79159 [Quercus suber]
MTVSIYAPGGSDQETAQDKSIADAAVVAGAQFLIYSTVPSPTKLTLGQCPGGVFRLQRRCQDLYRGPARQVRHLRTRGLYAEHSRSSPSTTRSVGQLAVTNFVEPDMQFPLIDVAEDTGKFVGAMLVDPERYAGQTFCAATRIYTMAEIVQIMSAMSGKEIRYDRIPKDVFARNIPEASRETFLNMFGYFEDCDYYGPESKQLVNWAATNARGSPSTFENFLKRNALPIRAELR